MPRNRPAPSGESTPAHDTKKAQRASFQKNPTGFHIFWSNLNRRQQGAIIGDFGSNFAAGNAHIALLTDGVDPEALNQLINETCPSGLSPDAAGTSAWFKSQGV